MSSTLLPPPVVSSTVTSSDSGVDAKHPQWKERAHCYLQIELLACGGYKLLKQGELFLWRRPKEQSDVYNTRLLGMTYQNLIGSALGWYSAAMFREEWAPTFKKNDAAIDAEGDFYTTFPANVDRAGTNFDTFLNKVFECKLKFQHAWVLTDKPAARPDDFTTRAEQTAAGANDPYWILYEPSNVINWEEDAAGNLMWAVVWTGRVEKQFKEKAKVFDRWTYYDRQSYTTYEAAREDSQSTPNAGAAKQIGTGPHALFEVNRVPLRRLAVPELFWLANRALPQALDHLNIDNTFGHALRMANLPMPAVFGEYDEPPTASETALNVFSKDTKFEWLEPKGTSFEHSGKRLSALREEIYRQFYLQSQGKDSSAVASASSGYSKEMDWKPADDVLGKFAAWQRQDAEGILRDLADARGDTKVIASVRGTEFGEGDVDDDIATLELMNQADIPSNTLEKVVQKRVAMKLASDQPDEVQATIVKEIEAAPTKSERQEALEQQAQDQFAQKLQTETERRIAARIPVGNET